MPFNNALDRTVKQRGRAVLAIDRALGGAEKTLCPAGQLGR